MHVLNSSVVLKGKCVDFNVQKFDAFQKKSFKMFLKKLCKKSLVFPFFKQNDQYSGISDPYDQNTHPQFVYPHQSEESVKKIY